MLSLSLPRTLAVSAALFASLSACTTPIQIGIPAPQQTASETTIAFERWVNLHTQVRAMTSEQAAARIAELGDYEGTGQRYYYGLLHSQLENYPDWIRARDAFANLVSDTGLTPEQRGLADVLRSQNQTRINAFVKQIDLQQRSVELQKQLVTAEAEKTALQQKIQALTDLETSISTRKEE